MTSSSPQGRKHLKSVNKITFRSLEDERRIDNAFQPIRDRTNSENRVYNINNSEKYKKLTHTSFSHRINNSGSTSRESNLHSAQSPNPPPTPSSPRDRHTLWRESIFYRKNKIAKSNDSLLETTPSPKLSPSISRGDTYELRKALNRGNSVNEIATCAKRDCDDLLTGSTDHLRIDPRKSRSERHLFSLCKLKQTAISDCFSEDEISTSAHFRDNKKNRLSLTSNSINRQNAVNVNYSNISIFQSCEESPMEEHNADSSQETSPHHQQQSHQSVCKIIGGVNDPPSSSEEKTPLLESMELSQISPTDSESEPPL
ncbi:uncharacterized protein LOC119647466 [Hermetia illucens]|nr:uncharacterized protein LOC119647466 [Hermetia illucens]